MSNAGEYLKFPKSNSGARYHNVYTSLVCVLFIGCPIGLANPKSPSFAIPF